MAWGLNKIIDVALCLNFHRAYMLLEITHVDTEC